VWSASFRYIKEFGFGQRIVFDVGWFTLMDDFTVRISAQANSLSSDFGKLGEYKFLRALSSRAIRVFLPSEKRIYPHPNAIRWHRQNIFYDENGI
jgi:hypothetical protein